MADDTTPVEASSKQIAFDWQAYAAAPKVFSQYAVLNAQPDDVTLAFCVKVPGIVEDEPGDIGITQVAVFMSVPHFRRFAGMVAEQAARMDEALNHGLETILQQRREETDNEVG